MFFFKQRKPRRFNYTYKYYDSKRNVSHKEHNFEELKDTFFKGTKHLQKYKQQKEKHSKLYSNLFLFIVILILLFIWNTLKDS